MSQPDPALRGFDRALATLPLVGGGVTLIGSPTASAEPVTLDLLEAYNWFPVLEQRRLIHASLGSHDYLRVNNPGSDFHWRSFGEPVTKPGHLPAEARAAVVLAAVGCD